MKYELLKWKRWKIGFLPPNNGSKKCLEKSLIYQDGELGVAFTTINILSIKILGILWRWNLQYDVTW